MLIDPECDEPLSPTIKNFYVSLNSQFNSSTLNTQS